MSSNPAWLVAEVLRGSANKAPATDAEIDLPALQTFSAWCEVNGFTFDAVFDYETTPLEAINAIASVARGNYQQVDGKHSIVIDRPQTIIRQHFSPRNSSGFKAARTFADDIHGLRVRFLNAAEDWQQDERLVFMDGYDEDTATNIEALDLFGVTDADYAWREARFHLAQNASRKETFTIITDFEHLACKRGDLVLMTHDVGLIGLHWGRISTLNVDGSGDVTDVTLDEYLTYEAGKNYVLRTRSLDASGNVQSIQEAITNPATGDDVITKAVNFTTAVDGTLGMAVDDLAVFGETDEETDEFIVKEVMPNENLGARVLLIPAASTIHDSDTGPIPIHDPVITVPPDAKPPTPTIDSVTSEPGALILHVSANNADSLVKTARYEVHFRTTDPAGSWGVLPTVDVAVSTIRLAPVVEGFRYDIRLRGISAIGVASSWVYANAVLYEDDTVFATDFGIAGLELINQGNDSTFTGRSAKFRWRVKSPTLLPDGLTDPLGTSSDLFGVTQTSELFQDFEVRVLDADTQEVLRTDWTKDKTWEYTYEMNLQDANRGVTTNQPARRRFTVDVSFRDILENTSERASLTVYNPAPAAPLSGSQDFYIFSASLQIWAVFNRPRDADYVGMLMFATQTPIDFAPGYDKAGMADLIVMDQVGSPMVWGGEDQDTLVAEESWYIIIAAYDDFAKDPVSGKIDTSQLNFSPFNAITVQEIGDIPLGALTVYEDYEILTPIDNFWDSYNWDGWQQDPLDTWKTVTDDEVNHPGLEITTAFGAVSLVFSAWVRVHWATPLNLSIETAGTPSAHIDPTSGPRIRYAVYRDSIPTPIFESDDITVSMPGYYVALAFSSVDWPGPGTHVYRLKIKQVANIYTAGNASRAGIYLGNDRLVSGFYTRWRNWIDVDGRMPDFVKFWWADEYPNPSLGYVIDQIPGLIIPNNPFDDPVNDHTGGFESMVLKDSINMTDKTNADYIITTTSPDLRIDLTKALFMATEDKYGNDPTP
jgi:hypothetical protein